MCMCAHACIYVGEAEMVSLLLTNWIMFWIQDQIISMTIYLGSVDGGSKYLFSVVSMGLGILENTEYHCGFIVPNNCVRHFSSVVYKEAPLAATLETECLSSNYSPSKSESIFQQDPQVIPVHIAV